MNVKDFQVVESYKQLRTNIVFAMSVRNTSVIEISSSYPGEGSLLHQLMLLLLWLKLVQRYS